MIIMSVNLFIKINMFYENVKEKGKNVKESIFVSKHFLQKTQLFSFEINLVLC